MMRQSRTVVLSATVGTMAVMATGAWFLGSHIASPADVAFRTAPPAPSPILVPIEQRVLSSDVVTRGTVRFGLPQPISLAPSALKGSAGLITTLPLRNAEFKQGDILLTTSGRPVFLLNGQIPAYRDLMPGNYGDDVRQLQEALRRLGFDPNRVDGAYDDLTSVAVAAWYKANGREPFGPTREQIASLRALERDWGDAEKVRVAAEATSSAAGLAVAAARATAAHNVRAAAATEGALRGSSTPSLLTVENERAKAAYANTAAAADLDMQIAEQALIALDPRQTEMARRSADAKLQMARAAKERIRIEGELAVQAAERDAKLAADRAQLARSAETSARLEGERVIRAALDAQRLAALDAKMAKERADQLAADRDAARKRQGFQVPADEVVFLHSFPIRVGEVTGTVGAAATGAVMSVTDNQLAIDSSLPIDAGPLVKPGMPVAIDEQSLGVKATGSVEIVAATPGTLGVDGFHFYMGIRIDPTRVRLEGLSVRLTIPVETTKGAVIAAPVSALSLAPDGTSRIRVQKEGELVYVSVRPGLSAQGYVEVSALGGSLSPGQLVVVGYNSPEGKDQK